MSSAEIDIEVVTAGPERLQELEPLWADMHAHHADMASEVAPVRPLPESWSRRRSEYEHWLGEGMARLLLAEHRQQLVGYLMLRFMGGASTWDIGDRVAEIESLSVLETERGSGIGGRLIEAAREQARADGARSLLVSVVHANHPALRFYERAGFGPFYVQLLAGLD